MKGNVWVEVAYSLVGFTLGFALGMLVGGLL